MTVLPFMCGVTILLSYAAAFFTQQKFLIPSVEPILLTSVIAFVANIATIFLVDLVGRKLLLIVSLIVTALGFFVISMDHMCENRYPNIEWVQLSVFMLITFTSYGGLLPVLHVYKMDVIPSKVRYLAYVVA